MTDIEMDRLQRPDDVATTPLITIISIVLMSVGLFASANLLKWVITEKLANSKVTENTQITLAVRERQLSCLAKNIYHEAGSEPFEGKAAVAQVVLNRVESGKFPNDICGVIYQKNIVYEKVICQFSWVCLHDTKFRPVNPVVYHESMEVAKKVLLEGFRLASLSEALYFHSDFIHPGWNRQKVTKIGRHIFYK